MTRTCRECGATATYQVLIDRASPVTNMSSTQQMWHWKNPTPCANPAVRETREQPTFIPGMTPRRRKKAHSVH